MASHSGYNRTFLGKSLAMPKLTKKLLAPLLGGTGNEMKYTHFSVFVNKQRRLPMMTAVNIRGAEYSAEPRVGTEPWDFSSLVDENFQIDNRFYGNDGNTFDRGHLVRRVDPCWGSTEIAAQAEKDTFVWPNCTPQHRKLNRDGGVWFQLEQHVMEKGVKGKIADISVFAGPVLSEQDPLFKKQYIGTNVPVPLMYWKVIVWKKSDGKLYAVGFMMSQWEFIKTKVNVVAPAAAKKALADDYFEKLKFKDHKTYQVPLKAIEKATGILFNWTNVKQPLPAAAPAKAVKAKPVKKVYAYATLNRVKATLANNTKPTLLDSKANNELKKIAPVPVKKVNQLISSGEGYLLKRYDLNNITL